MDVARGLTIRLSDAERLKTLYGSCIASTSDERESIAITQVGERIKAARMAAGLSGEALAGRLGVTKATISKGESAVHWPTAPQMAAIAAAFASAAERIEALAKKLNQTTGGGDGVAQG